MLFVLFVVKIWLKVPRATALCLKSDARRAASQTLCESRLAAREETSTVRKEHLESCSSLRLPLQELFKLFLCFFVLFAFKIWLKDPRAILPFGKDLAAREETAAVRGKHFGNCFPLRLSLQKLFKPFLCFFVFFRAFRG